MGAWDEDYEEERPHAPPLTVNHPYFVGTESLGWSPEDQNGPVSDAELERAVAKQRKRTAALIAARRAGL